jgi:hypothetical protein
MMTVPGLAARHRALVRQLGFRILANDAHAAPSRREFREFMDFGGDDAGRK